MNSGNTDIDTDSILNLLAQIPLDLSGLPVPTALHKNCMMSGSPAVAAVIEAVNELQSSAIPLLASPQGGVAASSIRCCEATEAAAAGVVFLLVFDRKTTPASRSAEASRYFVTRSATPPCGDARRGICSIPICSHL